MKIYSDFLTQDDLTSTIQEVPGMYLDTIEKILNPRLRERGWNVSTASTTRRKWKNNGRYRWGRIHAASFDDHGMWFIKLYAIDPNAQICNYKDVQDFHKKTQNRYASTLARV